MNVEDILAKVIAKYDSELLLEIITQSGEKNEYDELVDVDIDSIRTAKERILHENLPKCDKTLIREGLSYLLQLYTQKKSKNNLEQHHQVQSYRLINRTFEFWLIEHEKENKDTAKLYVNFVRQIQEHYYINEDYTFTWTPDTLYQLNKIIKFYDEDGKYESYGSSKISAIKAFIRFLNIEEDSLNELLFWANPNIKDIDKIYKQPDKQRGRKPNIQFEFHPKNQNVFKRLFILVGQADRYFYLSGKDAPIKYTWTMRSFSMDSNLKACIFSSTCYKENLPKGIKKIKLEIPYCEKYENYSLEQVNNEIDEIRQHILEEKQKRIKHYLNFRTDIITKNKPVAPLPNPISTNKKTETSTPSLFEETGKKLYEKLAEQGDASAQLKLAYMFYYGENVKQDFSKAAYFYEKAAEQKNANAVNNLGVLYAYGFGVKKDIQKAKILWELASRQGNTESKVNLQNLYIYSFPKNLKISKESNITEKITEEESINQPLVILHKKNKK